MKIEIQRGGKPQCIGSTLPSETREPHRVGKFTERHLQAVKRVIQEMTRLLARPMSTHEISEIACFSPYHFSRLFNELTGIPPIQFLYALRLHRAKILLATTDLCVTDICFEVGYNSLGAFISRFHKLVGLSPNAFRRFSREAASMELHELSHSLLDLRERNNEGKEVTGRLSYLEPFDGTVFVGLFEDGVPVGQPISCSVSFNNSDYSIFAPKYGRWRILAVAVPWEVSRSTIFTLEELPRGKTAPLVINYDTSDLIIADLVLIPPSIFDPPILTVVPLLVEKYFIVKEHRTRSYKARSALKCDL